MKTPPTRREVLTASGATVLAALAGCVGSQGTAADDPVGGADGTDGGHHDDGGHDDGGHGHGGLPEAPKKSAEVKLVTTDDGYHFDPHVTWVEPGATVTFHDESGTHTATAYAPANDKPRRIPEEAATFDSGTLSEGDTFEHTFETPGVYDVFCEPHESVGMIASVVVGEPAAEGQPGLAEPQSDLPEKVQSKLSELNEQCRGLLDGHHEDDGHHDDGTETGHHEEDGHHDDGTETGHHEEDGHHGEETETGHHDDETTHADDH